MSEQQPAPQNNDIDIQGNLIGSVAADGHLQAGNIAGRDVNIGLTPEEVARIFAELERLKQLNLPANDPAAIADLFQIYHHEQIIKLSAPRYQLDSRFVQITLLIDRGADTPEARFIADTTRAKYNRLSTLLAENSDNALVLLGKPGCGKTTLLRRLQLEHAMEQLDTPAERISFFVSLNGYRSDPPDAPPPDPYEWLAAEWHIRHPQLPDFKTLYQSGQMLLLLDGLNEMPHGDKTDYGQRIARWQQFWQRTHGYGNTIVFSCRNLDYSAVLSGEEATVRQTVVEPLTPAQIKEFLQLHLGEKSDPVWQTLRHDPQQLELLAAPFFLRLLVDQISISGTMPTGQAALLTGFVRRTLHREVTQHQLAPGTLLSADDCQQIVQNMWDAPFDLPDEGGLSNKRGLIAALEQLAYQMQDGRKTEEKGQVRVKTKEAKTLLAHTEAQTILEVGCQLNILDKDVAKGDILFYHQLIQEYFAARVLAQQPEPTRLRLPWHVDDVSESVADKIAKLEVSDPLPPLPSTGWEETTLLAAAMCPDQETFVRELSHHNLSLAARCAALPEVTVSEPLTAHLQEKLLALHINNPQADLRARIAAATALGELGDPRFARHNGPHGDYLLPPTVDIAAGTYPIGDDDSSYEAEKPAHTVDIAAFAMGQFAVTNAEYGLFMEAGGYEDEQWWQTEAARAWLRGEGSSEGQKQNQRDVYDLLQGRTEESIRQIHATSEQIDSWIWLKELSAEALEEQLEKWYPAGKIYHQPEYWEDGRFKHPSQPVVGLSWFEASAYCAWLSAQTGDHYRLPSEVEWEAAARGKTGRNYAWGETYSTANCNSFETHIRGTTPVGVFPQGHTPEGIADLSGNVWEWTTTLWGTRLRNPEFSYPYQADDGRENEVEASFRRVVRGGSWGNLLNSLRAAYRNYYDPDYRNFNYGFRVVVVRRSPSQ